MVTVREIHRTEGDREIHKADGGVREIHRAECDSVRNTQNSLVYPFRDMLFALRNKGNNKLGTNAVKFKVSTLAKILITLFWVVTHWVYTSLRNLLPPASGSVRRRQHTHTKSRYRLQKKTRCNDSDNSLSMTSYLKN